MSAQYALPGDTSFCGPYSVTHVSPVLPVISFDEVDTYSFKTLSEDYGLYEVTFAVTLDDYPDFAAQSFSFEVEIVPDCASAVIIQLAAISLPPTQTNDQASLDVGGLFTHSLAGHYADFCGPLQLALAPSAPPQTYLTLVDSVLTLEPTEAHAGGTFLHSLSVSLAHFPSAQDSFPFSVTITTCVVIGFFPSAFRGESLASAEDYTVPGEVQV